MAESLIAEIVVRLRLPQQITADQRDVDADHDGRRDRPAPKIARIVVLEPGERARGHFASRVSSADQRDLEVAGGAQIVHHLHDVAIGHGAVGAQEDALVLVAAADARRASPASAPRVTGSSPIASAAGRP